MPPSPRFLFLALDSCEMTLVTRWAKDGTLPNFKSIIDRSAWGRIDNPPYFVAGTVWASLYAGSSPAAHGFYQHRIFDPETYRVRLVGSEDYTVPTFIDIAGEAGLRVGSVDLPYLLPRQGRAGEHLYDWFTHAPMVDIEGLYPPDRVKSAPANLAQEVMERYGDDPVGNCDFLDFDGTESYRSFRDGLIERIRIKTAMIKDMIARGDYDLLALEFSELHCAAHHCWHFHDTAAARHGEPAVAELGNVLHDIYVAIDTALGEIVEGLDPSTTLMVYGSHGAQQHVSARILLDQILQRMEGAKETEGRKALGRLVRRTWRSLPVGLRRPLTGLRRRLGPTVEQAFGEIPRRKRRYFEVPAGDAFGAIRLNVVGREADGVVQPGAEFDEVCDQLARDLEQIVDADTGKPLITKIIRTADVYSGERLDWLPDMMVEWARTGTPKAISSPKIGTISRWQRARRTGDHTLYGFFMACGPTIAPQKLTRPVSVYDLAPSITKFFDLPMPTAEGKPLPELFAKR